MYSICTAFAMPIEIDTDLQCVSCLKNVKSVESPIHSKLI